jgi:error-prone DNA polymerase
MTSYVELHSHSCFSLLDGASTPEELIAQAAALDMPALALTDHDAVYGAVRFAKAAKAANIHAIHGAEITLADDSHITLIAADSVGWSNLCALITAARHNAPKGEARLPTGALEAHTDGLIALSGCRRGAIANALLRGENDAAYHAACHYRELFGRNRFWIEVQYHLLPDDDHLVGNSVSLARSVGVGYVATNNVHYATPDRHALQDVLTCIRHKTTLDECEHLRPNSEFYLKSGQELMPLFAAYPDALANSARIASMCSFQPEYGLQELPTFPTPGGISADDYLRQLCQRSMTDNAQVQLDYELDIIRASGLSNYFLIVWDIVRFAREQSILCQGRGSAANSLVAYLLGISPINPLHHDLVFERFLSSERQVMPDIDIDFDAARREEVIQYIYNRYGVERAAMACTYVTFRARSAVRDIGKALGLPPDLLDKVTTSLDIYDPQKLSASKSLDETLGGRLLSDTWRHVLKLSQEIDTFPRHLGIHNGGMVIVGTAMSDRLPSEPATMENRTVVQWDKDSLEDSGLVKIDILGLRMLSAVAEAESLAYSDSAARRWDGSYDDSAVYEMICRADTVGVFQVESRAQMNVLPRLRPRCFNDLVVCISLIRPGPIMGDMVHPYLRRRLGEEPVTYFHLLLEPVLRETLGVILFQEQVLKIARDLAGFTAGQGELLRRALGSKYAEAEIEKFRDQFLTGATTKGVDTRTAQLVFDKLCAFGGYSFPKSHAVSFAALVYRSAWLKHYYPKQFAVGLLNNQPMGFYTPAVVVNDIRRHAIPVLGVDTAFSGWRCSIEGSAIRLGFNYVDGFGESSAQQIVSARDDKPFADLRDFTRRTRLPRRLVENLIQAGALDRWGNRRSLLWQLGTVSSDSTMLDLQFDPDVPDLPPVTEAERASMEYSTLGLTTGDHPIVAYRATFRARGIMSSVELARLAHKAPIQVAGLLVVHQSPPTAKGFHFLTLEDEDGFFNIIIRPKLYARYWRVIRSTPLLCVEGELQRQGGVLNVIAKSVSAVHGYRHRELLV